MKQRLKWVKLYKLVISKLPLRQIHGFSVRSNKAVLTRSSLLSKYDHFWQKNQNIFLTRNVKGSYLFTRPLALCYSSMNIVPKAFFQMFLLCNFLTSLPVVIFPCFVLQLRPVTSPVLPSRHQDNYTIMKLWTGFSPCLLLTFSLFLSGVTF